MSQPTQDFRKGPFPILLSIVITVQNEAASLERRLWQLSDCVSRLASDYEIVLIDNGSFDDTSDCLRRLTGESAFPNLQVFALAGSVDSLTARWVGIENSLGDVVVCFDWHQDDLAALASVVEKAAEGFDLVFTRRSVSRESSRNLKHLLYRASGRAASLFLGVRLDSYSPSFIAVSRRIVNFILQFPDPQIRFRNLPSTTGFHRACLDLPAASSLHGSISLRQSLQRGIKLITSSSALPMRVATAMAAIGAIASVAYSIYIILVWLFKKDVAPGWASLSMQQSLMFFLISMVLLVMSEYILEISRKSNSGPAYYIADEFLSHNLIRKQRLNIEVDRGTRAYSGDSAAELRGD